MPNVESTLEARVLVLVASYPNLSLLGLEFGILLIGLHLDIIESLKLLVESDVPIIVLLQSNLSLLSYGLSVVLVAPELTLWLIDMLDQFSAADPLLHTAAVYLAAISLRQVQKRQLALVLGTIVILPP